MIPIKLPYFSHFTDQTVDAKYWSGKNMFSIHKGVLCQDITLRCPADLRILEARGLKVNFSLLVFPLLTSRQKSLNCFLFLESKNKHSLSLSHYHWKEFQWGYSLPIWILSHSETFVTVLQNNIYMMNLLNIEWTRRCILGSICPTK